MGVTHPFLVLVMFSIKEKEETRTLFDTSSMSGATMLMLVRTTMYSSGLPFQYLIGVSIERERESAPILNLKKMYSYLHGILARVHIAF
jgi:hypothetical protein